MKIKIFLLVTLATLLGCKDNADETGNLAYFGGEIINPNHNFVLLNSPDNISDTLFLDSNNRFLKKLTNLKTGLYKFSHGGEYQFVLLEPNDSIMLRLNTVDYDESLVFTGFGARKNNFLIASFLDNENNNKGFLEMMWEMEPQTFERALDSNRLGKLSELDTFLTRDEYSDYFKTIAKTTINYNYYFNKELYPFGYYGYNNLIHFKDLPEHFYDYRNVVDYNNEKLLDVIPYTRFLFWHFNNLALEKYYKNATHNVIFDKKSVAYNLEKLHLMDSIVDNVKVKNHLLKHTASDFISGSKDSLEIDEIVNSFLEKSEDSKDKETIKDLVTSVNNLKVGKLIPNIKLSDFDGNQVDLRTLITKPTVIYFWSSNLPLLLRNSHYKVNNLKQKFPDMDFIAININDVDETIWKKTINRFKFQSSEEFQFFNPAESIKQLALNSVNKSILVDKDSRIINSNAMIITSEFEKELSTIMRIKKASLK